MCIYMYICIYLYKYVYVYMDIFNLFLSLYIYIYIYNRDVCLYLLISELMPTPKDYAGNGWNLGQFLMNWVAHVGMGNLGPPRFDGFTREYNRILGKVIDIEGDRWLQHVREREVQRRKTEQVMMITQLNDMKARVQEAAMQSDFTAVNTLSGKLAALQQKADIFDASSPVRITSRSILKVQLEERSHQLEQQIAEATAKQNTKKAD